MSVTRKLKSKSMRSKSRKLGGKSKKGMKRNGKMMKTRKTRKTMSGGANKEPRIKPPPPQSRHMPGRPAMPLPHMPGRARMPLPQEQHIPGRLPPMPLQNTLAVQPPSIYVNFPNELLKNLPPPIKYPTYPPPQPPFSDMQDKHNPYDDPKIDPEIGPVTYI